MNFVLIQAFDLLSHAMVVQCIVTEYFLLRVSLTDKVHFLYLTLYLSKRAFLTKLDNFSLLVS